MSTVCFREVLSRAVAHTYRPDSRREHSLTWKHQTMGPLMRLITSNDKNGIAQSTACNIVSLLGWLKLDLNDVFLLGSRIPASMLLVLFVSSCRGWGGADNLLQLALQVGTPVGHLHRATYWRRSACLPVLESYCVFHVLRAALLECITRRTWLSCWPCAPEKTERVLSLWSRRTDKSVFW